MSAKFLNAFEDESPDLHKQYGCISGLFQVFDRQHFLARRRFFGQSHKALPSGNSNPESNGRSPKTVLIKNPSSHENQRTFEESSRTSCSSSSCSSSFSSIESNKSAQNESSIFDFRDIVKESIYRETHGLSVKTEAPKGGKKVVVKNKDSPRPLPLSRSMDSSHEMNRESRPSVDLDESLCVLAKLKGGGPWSLSEPKQSLRTSFESKRIEAARFSCDGREVSRTSLDSRESKNSAKLKETPRFSLDSRKSSLKEAERRDSNQRILRALSLHQDIGSNGQSPSVVARLMGLEAMPTYGRVCNDTQDSQKRIDCFSSSPVAVEEFKQDLRLQGKNRAPFKKQESVYGEIARKLNELEFQQSNKDLRALKHILDAIKTKGILETKRCEQEPSEVSCQKMVDDLNTIARNQISIPTNGKLQNSNRNNLDSPIVIMKPAKSANKCNSPPSAAKSFEGLAGHHKVPTGEATETKRTPGNNRQLQDRSPRRLPQSPREVTVKSSSGVSCPKMQQRRLALERKSQSEANIQRRQTKQSSEPDSPRVKVRVKARAEQMLDGRLSCVVRETRNSRPQEDEISQKSDSNISLASQTDTEVTTSNRSPKLDFSFFHGNRSSSTISVSCSSTFVKHKASRHFEEDCISSEKGASISEQPRPVSVLNTSFYKDESPALPVDGSSLYRADEEYENAREDLKNLQNITGLVQKIEHLSTAGDESRENKAALLFDSPNNRYILEVLQASGLLRMDLSNGFPKCNTSCPINPEMFLVLEQNITGRLILQSLSKDAPFEPSVKIEKIHRKLIFDTINEVLAETAQQSVPRPQLASHLTAGKIVRAVSSSQHLLEKLCSEIGQLDNLASQATGLALEDEEDDGLKLILNHDIAHHSEGWSGNGSELSALILDIERSIFKEMIDEVVGGEAAMFLQARSCRRRQPFAK